MSKEDLTIWQAIKERYARGDDITVRVKHEDTGRGWIALSIAFAAYMALQIAERCL